MKRRAGFNSALGVIALAISLALTAGIDTALADKDKGRGHSSSDRYDRYDRHDRHSYKNKHQSRGHVIHRGPARSVPHHRVRHYRNTVIVRPYGHLYPGYAYSHYDDDVYKWLSFTAITLKVLDNLNENQQRKHEAAQIKATNAPVGESVVWRQGNATGAVTAIREGTSTIGRYCREFLQQVKIGNKSEQAYGTACRQPDGSWEVIATGNR